VDDEGRLYFEWADDNVFVGFTYYLHVTSYDRGYFKRQYLYNKLDNFICHECTMDTLLNPDLPYCPNVYECTMDTLLYPDLPYCPDIFVDCEDAAVRVTVSVPASTDVQSVYAVPNPYRSGTSADTTPFYHNFNDNSIKFYNMPKEASLKIYTVAGDLVWETYHSSPDGSEGVATWDTKNKHGLLTGSGVYIFKVESRTGGSVFGRIVIIR
jgi:hypothetical protein